MALPILCVYCRTQIADTLDHILPKSQGGRHLPENLVPACASCNSSKGAKTPEQWITQILKRHSPIKGSSIGNISDLEVARIIGALAVQS